MFSLSKVGTVRFSKLLFHSIILTMILTFFSLLVTDLISLALGFCMEINVGYVSVIVLIWVLYALQNERYKKENNK